jgi:anaerobic magnesium-protoporphyrin IX monomethyl ester cyclase
MTRKFRQQGLIINEHLEEHGGTTVVVRTDDLEAEKIEFLRWRAERWIRTRDMSAAFALSERARS